MLSLINRLLLPGLILFYPFALFFLWGRVSPYILITFLIGFLFAKALAPSKHLKNLRFQSMGMSMLMCVLLACSYFVFGEITLLYYPVLMNLSMAFLFFASLIWPPNLISYFARITNPNLDEKGMAYTKTVTLIWGVFCSLNALISLATVVLGDMYVWTLYNGFISYVLMGALFLGEYVVRHFAIKGKA